MMVVAGYAIELIFKPLHLVPEQRHASVISFAYTTWLNVAFLVLAVVLLVRSFITGGRDMLRIMGGDPDTHDHGGEMVVSHPGDDLGHEHGARRRGRHHR